RPGRLRADPPPTAPHTPSLHDALPLLRRRRAAAALRRVPGAGAPRALRHRGAAGPIPGRLRDDLPSSLDAAASWRAQRAVLFRATGPGGEHLEATERDQLPFRPPWRGLSALACARGIRTPRAHPYPGRR